MKKHVSIRTKLVQNTMIMISVIFFIVLSVISTLNIVSLNKNIQKSKATIRNSLEAKGKTLVKNNSMAMKGMVADNAFTAVQELVASTVQDDRDLVYGIFMDATRTPWVNATKENPSGAPASRNALEDSISTWAFNLKQQDFKTYVFKKNEVIEFAAPIISDDEIKGYIRYGLSTKSMQEAINEALASGKAARNQTIGVLIVLCLLSLGSGYIMIKRLAVAITKPIGLLVGFSKVISEGNYDVAVTVESNDEIGDLAEHFESMRATIKKYTDHLQDLIDEKMQQVNDILNNIDQGLFTFSFDGKVAGEYSACSNNILKVDNIANHKIAQLLRLSEGQEVEFYKWIELIKDKHATQRWKKLVKLAPIQELELGTQKDQMQFVSISYQKIFDKQGKLSKIMVLAMDETEKRLKDQQMAEERMRHENEVKTILGISNTPPEEIAEFMEDTTTRLRALRTGCEDHLAGVMTQREQYPQGPEYDISNEMIDIMYRDMHTIKGNGGSYGFDMLSIQAHQAESLLEQLRQPVKVRRAELMQSILEYLNKMDASIVEIQQKIQMIFGKDEEITVRVPESRILKLQEICQEVKGTSTDPKIEAIVEECIMLSWKPLKTLTRKYQKIAQKAARKLHKNIEFVVVNDLVSYSPETLTDLDDVLIHIVRNSVDHGIENPEVREELGKGVGHIKIEFEKSSKKRILKVSDDGKGIDIEKLAEVCINKKIATMDEVNAMSDKQKCMLMFRSGVSTAETVTDISGRGMGMNIVEEKLKTLGGSIDIDSIVGKGTTITMIIPEPS